MSVEAGYNPDIALEAAREEAAYSLGVQAYLWGKPLLDYGRAVLAAIRAGNGKLNCFCQSAVTDDNPAGVILDTCGFWDARTEPVCVIVPHKMKDQGYIVQFADMFGDFFHVIGGRQGPQPGLYVITGPNDRTVIPPNARRLPARTRMGLCVARIFGGDETAAFRMMPLSAYSSRPKPALALMPYDCDAPQSLLTFDRLGYWMRLAFPPSADDQDTLIASFRLIGLSAAHGFGWRTLDETIRRGVVRAIRRGDEMVDAGRGWQPLQADAPVSQWQAALTGYRLSGHLTEAGIRAFCGMTC